jgi:transposase
MVREFVETTNGRIELERLPAYAPELNPVEYLWANLKHHEMANFCPTNFQELSAFAKKKLARIRRRPKIVRACWKLSQLSLDL